MNSSKEYKIKSTGISYCNNDQNQRTLRLWKIFSEHLHHGNVIYVLTVEHAWAENKTLWLQR